MIKDQMFDMHITVPAKVIGNIIELLSGEGILVSISPKAELAPKQAQRRYVGGRRNKGISGIDVIIMALGSGHTAGLTSYFARHDFSVTSVSPSLTKARAAGLVEGPSDNLRLTDKGVQHFGNLKSSLERVIS